MAWIGGLLAAGLRLQRRAPMALSGPDRGPMAQSGPDQAPIRDDRGPMAACALTAKAAS